MTRTMVSINILIVNLWASSERQDKTTTFRLEYKAPNFRFKISYSGSPIASEVLVTAPGPSWGSSALNCASSWG